MVDQGNSLLHKEEMEKEGKKERSKERKREVKKERERKWEEGDRLSERERVT